MTRFFLWVGALAWVSIGAAWFCGVLDFGRMAEEGAAIRKANARAAEAVEQECQQSAICQGERFLVKATQRCRDDIEQIAKYQHEWTDAALEPKFSRYRWKDRKAGVLTFIGDKIKFQNGFGAWEPYVYECDFSVPLEAAAEVRVRPGRL